MSAVIGSRSANRGCCGQACRLPFSAVGNRNSAALSLKDLSLLENTDKLREIGVDSLKIEGRMKRPEYVAAASAVYSAAARGEAVAPDAVETLKKVFSRTGFTDGYYTHRLGGEMFGTRRKEDVTAAADVLGGLARLYDKEMPLIPVSMDFTADTNACSLTVTDEDGHRVRVTADGAEAEMATPVRASP